MSVSKDKVGKLYEGLSATSRVELVSKIIKEIGKRERNGENFDDLIQDIEDIKAATPFNQRDQYTRTMNQKIQEKQEFNLKLTKLIRLYCQAKLIELRREKLWSIRIIFYILNKTKKIPSKKEYERIINLATLNKEIFDDELKDEISKKLESETSFGMFLTHICEEAEMSTLHSQKRKKVKKISDRLSKTAKKMFDGTKKNLKTAQKLREEHERLRKEKYSLLPFCNALKEREFDLDVEEENIWEEIEETIKSHPKSEKLSKYLDDLETPLSKLILSLIEDILYLFDKERYERYKELLKNEELRASTPN